MKRTIGTLSALIAITSVVVGLWLMASNTSGGFIPDLGYALAGLVLASGNLLALALNGIYWRLYGAPRWLRIVVALQVLPALACLFVVGRMFLGQLLESRASAQMSQIRAAIEADDPERLFRAQTDCAQRCTEQYSLDKQLLDAADDGALRVASKLIDASARVASGLGMPNRDIYLCEGLYLPSQHALSIAVARDNAAMIQLLLPVSDAGSRREALWRAAQLDRLDILKSLADAGVPLTVRGSILDENDTLLVAAASGAGVQVGRWLIESQHMPVNALRNGPDPYAGTAPLSALFEFMSTVGSPPRAASFLTMLVAHGADLDAPTSSGWTLLEEAVRIERKDLAQLLLGAGASADVLNASRHKALEDLLNTPDASPRSPLRREGCIEARAQSATATSSKTERR